MANGADSIYLGAEKFNARDEGAQLTLDELEAACALAHSRGVRIYLTLNTLVKPGELEDALGFLGEAIGRGIDAAIVQDVGLVTLIHKVYPGFEIHGSTQMTVHDASGARLMSELGIDRVVLARENTIDDIRAIRAAVPERGLETFILMRDDVATATREAASPLVYWYQDAAKGHACNLIGTPGSVIATLREYVDIGVRHFELKFIAHDVDDQLHMMRAIAERVVPAFR